MNKTEKQQIIDDLSATFAESKSVILMQFSGLNVADVTELRRKVRQAGSGYRVVKNTLAVRAAKDSQVSLLAPYFQGTTAVVHTAGDPIALAKVLTEFVKTHPAIKFKAGVLDQSVLTPAQCQSLAEMPSKEQLLAKLLYLLNAPVSRLAGSLISPLSKLALALKQLEEQKAK
jgi:large subunit ribosomal protein L10